MSNPVYLVLTVIYSISRQKLWCAASLTLFGSLFEVFTYNAKIMLKVEKSRLGWTYIVVALDFVYNMVQLVFTVICSISRQKLRRTVSL